LSCAAVDDPAPEDHSVVYADVLQIGESPLRVSNVTGTLYLELAIDPDRASVEVWTNDRSAPTSICIRAQKG
jgi:hypothetical protein